MVDAEVTRTVECRSETRYAQRPRALHWAGARLEVTHIEAEWRTPGGYRFLVQTYTGQRFELQYSELRDEWRIYPQ